SNTMSNHGPSYGLSRELERKSQARFNLAEAHEVLLWIETSTGRQFCEDPLNLEDSQAVSDVLKDGISLCELMNRLGIPTNFHTRPKMAFHQMENISNFLESAKAYGVPDITLFQTVNLFENKDFYKVIECLRDLAGVAAGKEARGIEFPPWVIRKSVARPRAFPEHIKQRGQMVIPLQSGTNKCATQKGMTPYGLPRQIKPSVTDSRNDG
ncbi:hypothetical protein PFISCL1PPCAC_6468, partial [Pristionchus fissidentatus]